MRGRNLTELAIERAKPAATGSARYELWDAVLPSFGLRVSQSGSKSFFVMYRLHGRLKRLTLGRYPVLKLDKARKAAREALEQVQSGVDPAAAAIEPARPATVAEVLAIYYERRLRPNVRTATATEAERAIRKSFESMFGDRPIASLTRTDIFKMLDAIVDRGAPVHANRVLTLVKTFFKFAVERGYIDTSPAASISPPTRESTRERVLEIDELVRIWRASDRLGQVFGPIIKLLILTAQRRDEVGEMRRREIDRHAATWTIPADRAKNGIAHEVALAPEALSILDAIHHTAAPFVFTTNDRSPVSGWSKIKRRLDKLLMAPGETIGPPVPMAHWVLHDLRRSAATAMAELGTAPHVVDRVLNHTQGSIRGVAKIYNRFEYKAEQRVALEGWARHMLASVEGRTGNVVQFRA